MSKIKSLILFSIFLFSIFISGVYSQDYVSFKNSEAGNLNDPSNPIILVFENSNYDGVGIVVNSNELGGFLYDWSVLDRWIELGEKYNKNIYFKITNVGSSGSSGSGIEVYSKNNFYWQYNGEPTVLIGGASESALFHWTPSELNNYLNELQSLGGNYIRNSMSISFTSFSGGTFQPFEKTSSGKYDLDRWNEDYWEALRNLLDETQKRGIVVQLEIWNHNDFKGSIWNQNAWNPNNNINYDSISSSDFFRAPKNGNNDVDNDLDLYQYQKKYVDRLLETSVDFDNVIYQVDDLSSMDYKVSRQWAYYIRNKADSLHGKKVHVTESRSYHPPSTFETQFHGLHNENVQVIRKSDYDYYDISAASHLDAQDVHFEIHWYKKHAGAIKHAKPLNLGKFYSIDWPLGTNENTKSSVSDEIAAGKIWRALFASAAAINLYGGYDGNLQEGLGFSELGKTQIKAMNMFLGEVDIQKMGVNWRLFDRRSRAKDEAYHLDRALNSHAILFTGVSDRSIKLDLRTEPGTYRLRYLDVMNARWQNGGTITGGRMVTLSSPGTGLWVLLLDNYQGNTPSSKGLTLHYKFDENSGLVANDASSSNNDGEVALEGYWRTSGKSGGSMFFDGENYVVSEKGVTNPGVHDLTAAAWFNVHSGADHDVGFHRILTQGPQRGSGGGSLWLTTYKWPGYMDLSNRFGDESLGGQTPLENDRWYHGAIVVKDGIRSIYLDGVPVRTQIVPGIESSNGEILIGRNKYLTDGPFYGRIDDVQIYDRALNMNEMKYLYDNPGRALASPLSGNYPDVPDLDSNLLEQINDRYSSNNYYKGFFTVERPVTDSCDDCGGGGNPKDFLSCHVIKPGNSVPFGYGSPYDYDDNVLEMRGECSEDQMILEIGNVNRNIIIYHKGYYYRDGQWREYSLNGETHPNNDQWIIRNAAASFEGVDTSKASYMVAFICKWDGSRWKCGCTDQACTSSSWNLQILKQS